MPARSSRAVTQVQRSPLRTVDQAKRIHSASRAKARDEFAAWGRIHQKRSNKTHVDSRASQKKYRSRPRGRDRSQTGVHSKLARRECASLGDTDAKYPFPRPRSAGPFFQRSNPCVLRPTGETRIAFDASSPFRLRVEQISTSHITPQKRLLVHPFKRECSKNLTHGENRTSCEREFSDQNGISPLMRQSATPNLACNGVARRALCAIASTSAQAPTSRVRASTRVLLRRRASTCA